MSIQLYNNLIKVGTDKQPITPTIVLSYRSGERIGVINNIDSLVISMNLVEPDEVTFDVHKYADSVKCALWDDIKDFKFIYIPDLDGDQVVDEEESAHTSQKFNPWYELKVTVDEDDETIKHCECIHAQEAELSQLTLNNVEINTETDISRDDYVPTVLYNPENPDGSLLDRILHDKATHYSIAHVDDSIKNQQRTFEWDGDTIHDAFNDISEELECLFVYGDPVENTQTNDKFKLRRTISVYDLNDSCNNCGNRGTFTDAVCPKCGSSSIVRGYGKLTNVFLNHENFASNISYSSNADEVKNCFRLEAGDDLMTDTIRNINPSGSQYIWYFSDATKSDMSQSLRDRLDDYEELYSEYESDRQMNIEEDSIDSYNSLVDKYSSYDSTLEKFTYPVTGYSTLIDLYYNATNLNLLLQTSLAPASSHGSTTTAVEQAENIYENLNGKTIGVTNFDVISKATSDSQILLYAKVFFDTSLYNATVVSSSISSGSGSKLWDGEIKLTSFTDDTDTATVDVNVIMSGNDSDYLKSLMIKSLKGDPKDATDIVALFALDNTQFAQRLTYYSVDNLSMLASACQACIYIMEDGGVTDPSSQTYADMYTQLYLPYTQKRTLIETELNLRENEVNAVTSILSEINSQRMTARESLDLRTYLGETLWAELCSFRRDDEYKNDNYITDGLTDSQIISKAKDFIDTASRELYKSAMLQHSISCDFYDFDLVNDNNDLHPIINDFDVGNWIQLEVDDSVYRLRLVAYVISYDDLTHIEIDFSDVTYSINTASDVRNMLDNHIKSISTSANKNTERQARTARTKAEQAEIDAGRANDAANNAERLATSASSYANKAASEAYAASIYANSALGQLSIVEDVVGTLNWISEHAEYGLTQDTEVVVGKLYFTRSGSGTDTDPYVYAVTPITEGNPSALGLYEVTSIDEAVSNYISTHLALVDSGLIIMADNSGYKMRISNTGAEVLDQYGTPVAVYSTTTQIGSKIGAHMEASGNKLAFKIGDEEVAYISVDENTGESLFYMTKAIIVRDLTFSNWRWRDRENGNLTLKWTGGMV